MIAAWAKAMTVCAHGEDVPFRALTKSTLESISRFWWRLFPWATKETCKHGRDSEKNSFLEDAEISHRLLWLKDSPMALLNPQNHPAAKAPFTQVPIFSFSLL